MSEKSSSSKKSKRSPISTLDEAFEATTSGFFIGSLLAFLTCASVKKLPREIFRVFGAIYRAQAHEENTHICPKHFRKFDIKRDNSGRILAIRDLKTKTKLSAFRLKMALVTEAARKYNSTYVIIKGGDLGEFEALFLPEEVHIVEPDSEEEGGKAKHLLHNLKSTTSIYTTPERLKEVLSIPYISLELVAKLVSNLNQADRTDSPINIAALNSIEEIQSAIQASDKARRVTQFLTTLMTMCLGHVGWEEKITAFEKYPSSAFARELGLSVYYQGKVFTANKQFIRDVNISELEDDDHVIVSKVPISELEFKSIKAGLSVEKVIPFSDNLGTLRNGKWTKATNITHMSKSHLARFYAAVATTSKGDLKMAPAEAGHEPDDDDTDSFNSV